MATIDLFAAQTYVSPKTYASEASFQETIGRLVDRCTALRAPDRPAVAVFPEHIGTFLGLAALGRLGPRLRRAEVAMALAVLRQPLSFARALRRVGLRRTRAAALIALSPEVAEIYERTFSELAHQSGMTIVAGSALLADDGGRVYNQSLTFDERGQVVSQTRKVNLVPDLEDGLGLTAGAAKDLEPVEVAAGRLGTLICYDGFAVPHTRREPTWRAVGRTYADRGTQILAQPAANPWPWDEAWVHRDPGSDLLRREQWRREGLEAQLPGLDGVRYAVTAHLIGEVLGERFDGRSAILERRGDGGVEVLAEARRADLSPESEEVVHARACAPWLRS